MNLADVSIRRPVFAVMMIAALVVFGIVSYPRIGVDLFPDVEFPVVTVTVVYPGGDPETMESKVADPIEEQLNTLSGIKVLRSVNLESVTQVVVQFQLEVPVEQAVQDIRDKMSQVQKDLPDGIDPPTIQKFDVGAAPIMAVALSGKIGPKDLTHLADKVVKERVQRVPGVGGVDLVGDREREIQVLVNPAKLVGMGLAVTDVENALKAQNLDIPGGHFERGSQRAQCQDEGRGEERGRSRAHRHPQPDRDARSAYATWPRSKDTVKDARSASFLDGTSAISLVIRKQSGGNTVEVARRVRAGARKARTAS